MLTRRGWELLYRIMALHTEANPRESRKTNGYLWLHVRVLGTCVHKNAIKLRGGRYFGELEMKKNPDSTQARNLFPYFLTSPNRQTTSLCKIKRMNKSPLVLAWHASPLAGSRFAGCRVTHRCYCVSQPDFSSVPGVSHTQTTPTPVVFQSLAGRPNSWSATCSFLHPSGKWTKSILESQAPMRKRGPLQPPQRNQASGMAFCSSDPHFWYWHKG